MIIAVPRAGAPVRIEAPEDFKRFHVEVDATREELPDLTRVLPGIAEMAGPDHAWISESALRAWPGLAAHNWWRDGLTQMIEKARPHGWIDAQRQAIKAHIRWRGA